jgi:hypothetical protein
MNAFVLDPKRESRKKGASMKPASELLTEMAQRAKEAENSAASLKKETRTKVEARCDEIEASLRRGDDELRTAMNSASRNMKEAQTSLRDGFEEKKHTLKAEIGAHKAARDVKRATKRADSAEADASMAVYIAMTAIEQAEYSVLDAHLARTDADALAAS